MTRFPFTAAPRGWFHAAYSGEVEPGAVVTRRLFGRDLVCYRGESGALQVMDAFCPHNGAHLGYGGRVEGDDLVCPFHGWRFDASGANVDIPYSDHVNRRAHLCHRHVCELAGIAFVWNDPGGGPPGFTLPELPEATDDAFQWHVPGGACWKIRTHPQEILENTVDLPHFQFVHKVSAFVGATVEADGARFRSVADVVFPTPRGDTAGQVDSELWGLGLDIVRRHGLGPPCPTLMTLTPVDVEEVEARYTFLLPKDEKEGTISRFGQAHVRDFMRQIEADIPIWEHKIYEPHPKLTEEESAVGKFRRWAAQFYTG